MKKRKLKSLELSKKSISKLGETTVKGGLKKTKPDPIPNSIDVSCGFPCNV